MPPVRQNEPMSALTHLIGVCLSIAGLALLVVIAAVHGSTLHVVSFTIFGATMLLLYLSSTIYHFICITSVRAKRVFQIFDHVAIYLLIAGTYTPVALIVLPPGWGWTIFGLVWFLAVIGTVIKGTGMRIPSWVSLGLYLLMGWLILIAFFPLVQTLPSQALFWLALGGIWYTLGAVFFALDRIVPRTKWFGMHEVFHICVMLGSFSHFWLMFRYLVNVQ